MGLWYGIQPRRYNSRCNDYLSAFLFFQTQLIHETLFQLSYPCFFFKNMCTLEAETSHPSSHSCGKGHLRSRERIRNNIVKMIHTAKPIAVYGRSTMNYTTIFIKTNSVTISCTQVRAIPSINTG